MNIVLELLKLIGYTGILLLCMLLMIAIFIWRYLKLRKFTERIRLLRKRIHKNWFDNPSVHIIRVKDEYTFSLYGEGSPEIYVKVIMPSRIKKPTIKDCIPFLPPFRRGALIDEITPTHCLLYNGFSLTRCHCLVTTKRFEDQSTKVSVNDFAATLLAMKAAKSCAFYNSGPDAGSSQRHKHLQLLPYAAFRYGLIPIERLIQKLDKDLTGKLFTLPEFKFKHIFYMFEKVVTSGLKEANLFEKAKKLENDYERLLKYLENENRKIPYNLVITRKWMFVVLRKKELIKDSIKINALGFLGSFMVNDEKDLQYFPVEAPLDALLEVTYPITNSNT